MVTRDRVTQAPAQNQDHLAERPVARAPRVRSRPQMQRRRGAYVARRPAKPPMDISATAG
jgi:hypothetical protein